MSQDISKSSGQNFSKLPSIAKALAKLILMHPLYIAYLIFFSPYILKLVSFLSPLLILLLATVLCAFSTTTSLNNNSLLGDKIQENASDTLLEAEAYKIISDTFQDSFTSLADEFDDVEPHRLIEIEEASTPVIVKSCCSFTPLKKPPLHEIIAKPANCDGDELPSASEKPVDVIYTKCDEEVSELEIVKSRCSSTSPQDPPSNENADKTTFCDEDELPSAVEKPEDAKSTDCKNSDEVEAEVYELVKTLEALLPYIVKSRCLATPLQDPPLCQIVAKTTISDENERPEKQQDPKSTNCSETEIIKRMVCTTINEPDKHESEDPKLAKSAGRPLMTKTTTPKTGSNANANLHKTSLKSYDSKRREKEWTRTLACKLFEERHNRGGGRQGDDKMDLLWETYESIESPDDYKSDKEPQRHHRRRLLTTLSRRSSRSATAMEQTESDGAIRVLEEEDDDDVEEEGNDVGSGKMCCLQALKISSGKVNLGIGRKNMMRISKALRGFGWLHKTTNFNTKSKK